jgi:cellulose biosynthesis protein BcsQ
MASVQMNDMLTQLRDQYDHIVVDTPPTLSVTDAVVLSTRADAVVLVIRSAQTTKPALRRARYSAGQRRFWRAVEYSEFGLARLLLLLRYQMSTDTDITTNMTDKDSAQTARAARDAALKE